MFGCLLTSQAAKVSAAALLQQRSCVMPAISCIVIKQAPRDLEEDHCPEVLCTAHRLGPPVPQEKLEVRLHEKFHFSLEGTNWNGKTDGWSSPNYGDVRKNLPPRGGPFPQKISDLLQKIAERTNCRKLNGRLKSLAQGYPESQRQRCCRSS